jgi:5-methylcytosine-specific restriction endonuclease McrA
MKTCTKCGETKPHSDYHSKKSNKDGLNSACKSCNKSAAKSWYASNLDKAKKSRASYQSRNAEKCKQAQEAWRVVNIEKHKATKAAWKAANLEKEKEFQRLYKEKNADKIKQHKANYIAKNPDKVKESKAAWRSKNHDAIKVLGHNRRAKLRSSGGRLSKDIEIKLLEMQRGMCACCRLPLDNDYHIDHIIPLALGGTNTDDNVQLLRAKCNMQKGAKHPIDFMQERGYLL